MDTYSLEVFGPGGPFVSYRSLDLLCSWGAGGILEM